MAHVDRRVETSYSPALLTALEHGGSWAREARVAMALAAQLCRTLNEDALIFGDVRDVQAVSASLQRLIEKKTGCARARLRLRPCGH